MAEITPVNSRLISFVYLTVVMMPHNAVCVLQPEVVFYRPMQAVVLTCSLLESNSTIIWIYNNTKIETHGNIGENEASRYIISSNQLKIRHATLADEGKYTCLHDTSRWLRQEQFQLTPIALPECVNSENVIEQIHPDDLDYDSVYIYNPYGALTVECFSFDDNLFAPCYPYHITITTINFTAQFNNSLHVVTGNKIHFNANNSVHISDTKLTFEATKMNGSVNCSTERTTRGRSNVSYISTYDFRHITSSSYTDNDNIRFTDEVQTRHENRGSSFHGTFYIQGFTAVAVLVLLFFSVSANVFLVCLMLKGVRCAQLMDKTHILRNWGAHNEIAIPEVFSREMEILHHHYETINDDEILPPTLVMTTQTISALESTPVGDGDQGQTRSFTLPQDVITVEPSRYSMTLSSVSTDSNVSLRKPIEVLNENAYLNPYVALRINEMEYLSSYSALTNAGSPFRHVP